MAAVKVNRVRLRKLKLRNFQVKKAKLKGASCLGTGTAGLLSGAEPAPAPTGATTASNKERNAVCARLLSCCPDSHQDEELSEGSPRGNPPRLGGAARGLPEGRQLSQDALEWSWMLSPEFRGNFSGEKVLQSPAFPLARCKQCSPRADAVAGCRKVRENWERQ